MKQGPDLRWWLERLFLDAWTPEISEKVARDFGSLGTAVTRLRLVDGAMVIDVIDPEAVVFKLEGQPR